MILTLIATILFEGVVVIGYCIWRKKPAQPILFTSVFINLITQSLLWIVLNFFFSNYLVALLVAEILIWLIESLALYSIPANQLKLIDAISLSLGMNLLSLTLGWFLPV